MASRRRWLESQGRDDARQENGRNEWYDLGYQGAKAKAPPCSNSTLQTPLPQQGSSSAGEEEDHLELREERRKRRIAFESLAKGMLRYLDNGDGVKVGITELQERLEVPAQIGISIQQVAQQAMNENGRIFVRNVLARRRFCSCGLLDQMGSATERLGLLGKRVSRHKW